MVSGEGLDTPDGTPDAGRTLTSAVWSLPLAPCPGLRHPAGPTKWYRARREIIALASGISLIRLERRGLCRSIADVFFVTSQCIPGANSSFDPYKMIKERYWTNEDALLAPTRCTASGHRQDRQASAARHSSPPAPC